MFKLLSIVLGQMPMFQNANNSIPTPQAYTFSAPIGVPGDITRQLESNVEPAMLVLTDSAYPLAFGIAMAYATGGIGQMGTGTYQTAAVFAGVLVREVPSISGSSADDSAAPPAGGTPNPDQPQGLCVRGYICVQCGYGTPARGGIVYVRVVATSNNEFVGTFDATSDSTNNVALTATQATWACDGKDATNNAELRIAR
jgi:hypothetical protein